MYRAFIRLVFILALSCGTTVGANNGVCADDVCSGTACPPGSFAFLIDGQCTCTAGSMLGTITINPDPFIVGERVAITLRDYDLVLVEETRESVDIVVTSTSGESETVTLTATGTNSPDYSGTLATTFSVTAGANNDGTINAQNGDTLTASYVDTTVFSGGPENVTDTAVALSKEGSVHTSGEISIAPKPVTVGQPVLINVTDADLNADGATAEVVDVVVISTTGETETVTLTETGLDTGIFAGTLDTIIALSAGADNDGVMNAGNGDTLTARYLDAATAGGGATTVTDTTDVELDETSVVGRTETVISNFMSRRADLITSAEPDLASRLTGGGGGVSASPFGFTADGNSSRFTSTFSTSLSSLATARQTAGSSLAFYGEGGPGVSDTDGQPRAPRPAFDFWASGHWAHSDDETRSSTFGQFNLGADYLINPSLLVGMLAQFDWMDETDGSNNTSADGFGWMAGPYLVARLHQNLIFDGRVAWGQSDNHVDPLGLYEDKFATNRFLARGQLTGDFSRDKWRFSPHVALIHFQEEQKAYVDSLGFDIQSQTITLGRVTFGPEISFVHKTRDGTEIEPSFGVTGIWDYDQAEILDIGTGLANGSSSDLRMRVQGGLAVRMPGSASLAGDAYYDGIGADDLEIYGGSLKLRVPIN